MAGIRETIAVEDAWDVIGMLVATGRVVRPERWIDEMRLEAEANAFAGFGA